MLVGRSLEDTYATDMVASGEGRAVPSFGGVGADVGSQASDSVPVRRDSLSAIYDVQPPRRHH